MTSRLLAPLRRVARRPRAPESPWAAVVARGIPERTETGPRILLATSVGGHPVARVVDSLVGAALWVRGADPALLLCDRVLPACEQAQFVEFDQPSEFVEHGPQGRLCGSCFGKGASFYRPLPIPLRVYSEFLAPGERAQALEEAAGLELEDCLTFERDGLRLGEQARAGMFRFFGKADLSSEPEALVLGCARRYAAGAIVAARVAERVLAAVEPDCLVAHHGVYVPQGVLGEVARREGVRVVNWGPSYRQGTLIFSHDDTYHRTLIAEARDQWDVPLSAEQEEELMAYLAERRVGQGDWSWITPEAALRGELQERDRLVEELGLDLDRPLFGLLTNVLWDAQLYYEGHAFADMLDWLWTTIEAFRAHPDWQLLIRIHPHEIKQGNRQPVAAELEARYPRLPENVVVVGADHPFNTYALMSLCDAVLVYGTKTGVELAPLGQRVVVGGEAWIRGKGLTFDVESREEYRVLLERFAGEKGVALDDGRVASARRYAYHYFFRRMIPLSSLDPEAGFPPELAIETLDDLLPGHDPGLDVVCAGIVERRPFVFDAR